MVGDGKRANPVNEKKYFPLRGAVKTPDDKSMAEPMLSLSTSNGIGVLVVSKEVLL